MKIERVTLDNGLKLLFLRTHEAPVVAMQAWVDVGSADEDDEVAGIAHLHEHMLFKGTARRGVGEIARAVEAAGGEINAWTSLDETVYHLVLASDELGLGLDILADALCNSSFDEHELRREIEVVAEEIKRADDVPARRVSNALFALAYDRHPYRRPILGTAASVRSLDRAHMLAFFRRHYRPRQTTLVVVGDFDRAALMRDVDTFFGSWADDAVASKPPRPSLTPPTEARLSLLCEDVKEARLAVAWSIPGVGHDDVAALDVLSVLLGHGESSRLYLETRRRRQLVNDVYAYAYTPRDPGLFMIGAGLEGEKITAALAALLDETFTLREQLISDEELARAKAVIASDSACQRETVQDEARRLGYYEVGAGDHAYESRYLRLVRQVRPAKLREVARRYLGRAPCVVVQVPRASSLDQETLLAIVAARADRVAQRRARGSVRRGATTRLELSSGATLLVQRSRSPVVAMRAVVLGGGRWESRATAGLSALFASVFGTATQELGSLALARQVALLGGSLSAFAGRNTLGLRGEFVREHAMSGLELFSDALLHPAFVNADVERERSALIERARTREDSPAVMAFELFAETLYPTHPYGLRLGGIEETLRVFTREQLSSLRERFVAPDKLVIAVHGDIDVERVSDFLGRALEDGSRQPLPESLPRDEPPTRPRDARLRLDKQQAHIVLGGMGVTLGDEDRFVLEVLTTILSGQSGRLFLDLRDKQGLAYTVAASSVLGLDPGYVYVYMGTSPDKVERALAGLEAHLEAMRTSPPSQEELMRATRYLVGAHAIDLQRVGARAALQSLGERLGQGYDDYLRYPARIRAVTAPRVQEVARVFLDPERLVKVVVGP